MREFCEIWTTKSGAINILMMSADLFYKAEKIYLSITIKNATSCHDTGVINDHIKK